MLLFVLGLVMTIDCWGACRRKCRPLWNLSSGQRCVHRLRYCRDTAKIWHSICWIHVDGSRKCSGRIGTILHSLELLDLFSNRIKIDNELPLLSDNLCAL